MHPNLISLMLFCFVTSCTPGPNNILASYSSFNFGIKKTFPHMMGVALGYTSMITILDIGLILPLKKYPIIQDVLKVLGSIFLIYLAYKISFSKSNSEKLVNNPVKFLESYFFQFINPKGVSVATIGSASSSLSSSLPKQPAKAAQAISNIISIDFFFKLI